MKKTELQAPTEFVHLNVRSDYSVQDGLCRINELVEQCITLGMRTIALTDESNFYGAVKFSKLATQHGLKPIIGLDAWVAETVDNDHPIRLRLLCKSYAGYSNLVTALENGYKQRLFNNQPILRIDDLSVQHLIVLFADPLRSKEGVSKLKQRFGKNLYLEIQRTSLDQSNAIDTQVLEYSFSCGIPLAATNCVRFLKRSDYEMAVVRHCISQGIQRQQYTGELSPEQYLKSPNEMMTLFSDRPDAIQNTAEIASLCQFRVTPQSPTLPKFQTAERLSEFEVLSKQATVNLQRFVHLDCIDGLHIDLYTSRLKSELSVIERMGFAGYFLIVGDFVNWAKQENIPVGPGRGSGAGSLVAYLQGITAVDPIAFGLLFERFLNPERVSLPDFDIDFCPVGREKVIAYVAKKHGREKVAQLTTFTAFALKSVVRDVYHVYGLTGSLVNKIVTCVQTGASPTLASAPRRSLPLTRLLSTSEMVQTAFSTAARLEGVTKNVGRHAGGVVISPTVLSAYAPTSNDPSLSCRVLQLDKNDAESLGLVKFDFLGLRTLSVIADALDLIQLSNSDMYIELDKLPRDDMQTFELLCHAKTVGVFQLESSGMRQLLINLQPDSFEDVIALIALFRPGPLQSGMVNDFIDRKHKRLKVEYAHPFLEPILKPTYGVIVYQEQVMQIAQELAGFSLGKADILRRAMGKKDPVEMTSQKADFITGALQKGLKPAVAEHIFLLLEMFAAYGFNRSHSVAYAMISYQTAYLKAHYPVQFMTALLNSELSNPKKLTGLLDECRVMGIRVSQPDRYNASVLFSVCNNSSMISFGLSAVHGIGHTAATKIARIFRSLKPGINLVDTVALLIQQDINERALLSLAKAGVFDDYGFNRRTVVENMKVLMHQAQGLCATRASGQNSLFPTDNNNAVIVRHEDFPIASRLSLEFEVLFCRLSCHPYTPFLSADSQSASKLSDLISRACLDTEYKITGCVIGLSSYKTRMQDTLTLFTLDDGSGFCDVTVYGEVLSNAKLSLNHHDAVKIKGHFTLLETQGLPRFTASQITKLTIAKQTANTLTITISLADKTNHALKHELHQLLKANAGSDTSVVIVYSSDTQREEIPLTAEWNVTTTASNLLEQLSQFTGVLDYSLQKRQTTD